MKFPKQVIPLVCAAVILGALSFTLKRISRSESEIRQQLLVEAIPAVPDLAGWPVQLRDALRSAHLEIAAPETRLQGLAGLARLYLANGFSAQARPCLVALFQLQPQNPVWPYFLASQQRDQSDQSEAIKRLREVIRMRPDYGAAYFRLFTALRRQGDFTVAANALADWEAAGADANWLLRSRAELLAAEGSSEEAIRLLEKAVAGDFTNNLLQRQLESFYLEEGYTDKAAALKTDWSLPLDSPYDRWEQKLAQHCYSSRRLMRFAVNEIEAGNLSRAVELLRRGAVYEPGDVDLLLELSSLERALGDVQGALRSLRKAAEVFPERAETYLAIAEIERASGGHDRAQRGLSQAIEGGLRDADVLIARGSGYLENGSADLAEADFRAALGVDSDHPEAQRALGLLLLHGEHPEGVDLLKSFLEASDSPAPQVRLALTTYLTRRGELERSWEVLGQKEPSHEQSSAERRNFAIEHLRLGNAFANRGDRPRAIAVLEKGLAFDPDGYEMLASLGALLEQIGQRRSATDVFRRALAQQPSRSGNYLRLARLLVAQSRSDEAKAILFQGRAIAKRESDQREVHQFDALLDALE